MRRAQLGGMAYIADGAFLLQRIEIVIIGNVRKVNNRYIQVGPRGAVSSFLQVNRVFLSDEDAAEIRYYPEDGL